MASKTELSQASTDASDPLIGQSIEGKYTVVRLLGHGGMGKVYEAKHTALARRFAIKFLQPRYAEDRDVLRRFENEAKAAGGLEHPNLVAVTDFGRTPEGAPFLVMEYLQGEDCAKLLRRVGPVSQARAAGIVLQACRGLALAHEAGIIHRDLKPENLFLTDAGDGSDLVKVLDFGIAKLRNVDTGVDTSASITMGTAHYMSPEQVRGSAGVDYRTDIWSLGVVLYELLSGRRPFEGKEFLPVVYHIVNVEPPPLETVAPDLSPDFVGVVQRALAKDPADRYQTAHEFAEAIARYAPRSSAPPSARPLPTRAVPDAVVPERGTSGVRRTQGIASKPTLRNRAPWLLGAAAFATLAFAFAWRPRPTAQRETVPVASDTAATTMHPLEPAPTPGSSTASVTAQELVAVPDASPPFSPRRQPPKGVGNPSPSARPPTSLAHPPITIDTASPY